MTKTFTIKDGQVSSKEQLDEVRSAAERTIQFDEDCPELSPAMYKAFKCAAAQRTRRKRTHKAMKLRGKFSATQFFL